MAKSQETFSKKEREKQRKRKQQDRQEKMRERKSNNNKGKSLEDMMAYLDENGNLTDKPPDPKKKIVFQQEDIPISVPRQEERAQDALRTGTVTFFNDQKGFGFINDAQTRERIFFHVNDLAAPVKENDKVTFSVKKSPKGLVAMDVTLIRP
jgi:cold shock CspA family protein